MPFSKYPNKRQSFRLEQWSVWLQSLCFCHRCLRMSHSLASVNFFFLINWYSIYFKSWFKHLPWWLHLQGLAPHWQVICLTISEGWCKSVGPLWILVWQGSQVWETSPQGIFLAVILRVLVGLQTGPFTLKFFSFVPLSRSAHIFSRYFMLWVVTATRIWWIATPGSTDVFPVSWKACSLARGNSGESAAGMGHSELCYSCNHVLLKEVSLPLWHFKHYF